MQKLIRIAALFFLQAAFISCATLSLPSQNPKEYETAQYIPENPDWQNASENGEICFFSFENPTLPLRYTVAKIDLRAKNLQLVAYPNSETQISTKDFSFDGITIKDFQRQSGAFIAINTTQYAKANPFFSRKRKIIGLQKSEGTLFSPPISRYAALSLCYTQDNELKAKCISYQDEKSADADFAIGGFFMILSDGELFDSSGKNFSYTSRNSRTAAGVSSDGHTLFLLAVQGERRKKSAGLTYPECAKLLLALGANSAIEFDGGGSTGMIIAKKDAIKPQSKRKNACYIGFLFTTNNIFN